MNFWKKMSRRGRWLAAILAVFTLAACGPAPLGTSWPAVSFITTTCNDQTDLSVVVAFNDRIVMVDPADGRPVILLNQDCEPRPPDTDGRPKVWDVRGGGANLFFSAPTQVDDNRLLAAAYDQRIYEIDLEAARAEQPNGTPIQGRTGNTVASILASEENNLLYLGLSAKDLVALNPADFRVEWTVPTQHGVWAKPLLVEDTLYFTSLDHNLYAVDADSGDVRWTLDLQGAATDTPLYDEESGHLFVGSFARKIFEITLDGEILSEYATADWVWSTPVIVDRVLYASDLGGSVYALDADNGLSEIWKQKVAERSIRPTPVVSGDYVVVASRDNRIYWLNRADGTPVTDSEGVPLVRDLGAEILSDVLLVEPSETTDIPEPYIIVSTLATDKILVAYTLERGEHVWTYALT